MQARAHTSAQWDTVVAGLGRTGLACLRHLTRSGRRVAVTDSREHPPGLEEARARWPDLHMVLGGLDGGLLAAAREIVVSPGLAVTEPPLAAAAAAGVPLVSEIELFARVARAPVLAVTGSNGKSTVTSLVAEMARGAGRDVAAGGNLGTPALDLLRRPEAELYVLELSSFQLETTRSLDPLAAVVLNVSPDHMDRYPDLSAYAAAKARIFGARGHMVLNRDDPVVLAMARPDRDIRWFGAGAPRSEHDYGLLDRGGALWVARGRECLLPAAEIRLPGAHNRLNALAALALGEAAGLGLEPMRETLRRFPGLPHRTEVVAEIDGVLWINDSKATNVGAALAALPGMDRPVVLIAGGQGKGADFAPLGRAMAGGTRAVVLMGADAGALAAVVPAGIPVRRVADMDEAVAQAAALACAGDVVLLSPACASLDMFSSFEARGDAFRRAVEARAGG